MFFLSRFAKRFGKNLDGVSQETMEMLNNYRWPGNVRELQNIIERGVVLATSRVLTLEGNLLPVTAADSRIATVPERPKISVIKPEATSFEDVARQHIIAVLNQANWVIEGAKDAAQLLNLHPNTLRSRMKKLGIQRPQ